MARPTTAGTVWVRGGTLVDVEAGRLERGDVLIRDGVVAEVGAIDGPEGDVYDASGCYVAPGFIDIHTHVFSPDPERPTRLEADRIGVRQGVACVVDAGSGGAQSIDLFPDRVHKTQLTPAYAFVNIGSPGMPGLQGGHASRPELLDLEGAVAACERHREWLLGVKVLASASHTGSFGLEAAKIARKAAELAGLPLMIHIGNPPPLVDDVLDLLRPGDVVTHTYHGKVGGVLGHRDVPIPAFRDAVARGAVVDLGHGRSSFSFHTCERARAEGLPLHTISTDLHRGSLERPVVSLARTMTKGLALGLSLLEVVRAVTSAPARALGLDARGFGTLAPGRPAHLTLFRVHDEPRELEDATGALRAAPRWIEPRTVFIHGERHDRSAPV